MSKKPSLSAALHEVARQPAPAAEAPPQRVPAKTEAGGHSIVPPSRRGKKAISGYFDPAVSRQLHQLALEQDTSLQAMLAEALNDLFEKYQKPPIATG